MPYYDLKCKNCDNTFNMKATITQRQNGEIACPECGSHDLEAVFKALNYVVKSSNSCDASSCSQAHRCHSGCCHG
ncbi:MAG: zinc ribbon domain-containing protein [Clostridia bacterium]|nr:zinc ribbon domain-containing protein [Clostridia bacterium]